MEEEKSEVMKEFPTVEQFCLEVPLYKTYPLGSLDKLYNYYYATVNVDCHCLQCNMIVPFSSMPPNTESSRTLKFRDAPELYKDKMCSDKILKREFFCQRRNEHTPLYFEFLIHNNQITKYGQYPSMADLAFAELQKYRTILGNAKFREFRTAVGLISHGVGIGAFVYLRRILEGLIEEAHQIAISSEGWNEEDYQRGRMEENIKQLGTAFLPKFLVEHWQMYSILSKGIHELTEDECKGSFPAMKGGIKLILDEKIRLKEQKENEKEISKAIKGKHQELGDRKKEKKCQVEDQVGR